LAYDLYGVKTFDEWAKRMFSLDLVA
jgi:hypothetical protein